ncbi:MAG: hypothetical protein K1X83_08330 [Oligoflexia bacterium]|nr:hypothetical protein [Oligoflexia bacterium]
MDARKIEQFMALAGQKIAACLESGSSEKRRLGAQLLLSEVLEYVIKGLGVIPEFEGTRISDANRLKYTDAETGPDKLEMVDGLADVAYTMYWNALAFGVPLEQAFALVCDNNLQKFVKLVGWSGAARPLERHEWDCRLDVRWPPEVVQVQAIKLGAEFYAVGTDASGKVRKPSSYTAVDLTSLLS